MNLNELRFPLEANVQNIAHFIDTQGTYAFTFGSPFLYNNPSELKEKEAFLLASFNQQRKKSLNAEEVFTYYINSPEKVPHPNNKVKAILRDSVIYRGDGSKLGTIKILLQRGMFRSYKGLNANPIYDADEKLVGFAHYNIQNKSKDVYTCGENFRIPDSSLSPNDAAELESAGSIHKVYSYDIVEAEDVDNKDRFMAIFSPSKKAELTNNRIRYYGCEDNKDLKELLLTALFAFFWGTYIDIPMG
ncbi:MAG: hypothetical protein II969_02390 [Anaerolineaceae bacterium]|nr:hypothetical protein [Anaerolineaceae bacterium]